MPLQQQSCDALLDRLVARQQVFEQRFARLPSGSDGTRKHAEQQARTLIEEYRTLRESTACAENGGRSLFVNLANSGKLFDLLSSRANGLIDFDATAQGAYRPRAVAWVAAGRW